MLRFLCAKLFQKPVRVLVVKTGMPLKRPAAFQMNDALPGIQAVQMMLRRHERQQRLIVRMSYKIIAATALFFRSGGRHQFELTAQIHPFTENSEALFRFFQEKEGALNQGSLFKIPAISWNSNILWLMPPQLLISILVKIFFGCFIDRKSTRLNSSHSAKSRMPSSA